MLGRRDVPKLVAARDGGAHIPDSLFGHRNDRCDPSIHSVIVEIAVLDLRLPLIRADEFGNDVAGHHAE